ncbi:MAG: hypothetical protein MJ126_11335, partial [Lachnospiraceae bacterium]|nr:hypothetical protein [Lachnospiraceae bacterium]
PNPKPQTPNPKPQTPNPKIKVENNFWGNNFFFKIKKIRIIKSIYFISIFVISWFSGFNIFYFGGGGFNFWSWSFIL